MKEETKDILDIIISPGEHYIFNMYKGKLYNKNFIPLIDIDKTFNFFPWKYFRANKCIINLIEEYHHNERYK